MQTARFLTKKPRKSGKEYLKIQFKSIFEKSERRFFTRRSEETNYFERGKKSKPVRKVKFDEATNSNEQQQQQ